MHAHTQAHPFCQNVQKSSKREEMPKFSIFRLLKCLTPREVKNNIIIPWPFNLNLDWRMLYIEKTYLFIKILYYSPHKSFKIFDAVDSIFIITMLILKFTMILTYVIAYKLHFQIRMNCFIRQCWILRKMSQKPSSPQNMSINSHISCQGRRNTIFYQK